MELATTYALHLGDCLETLRAMPDGSVDSVVTDPPYGLEFMGKDWDAPWRQTSGGFSAPGIGERERAWPSFKGSNLSRCETCGKLVGQGGSPCVCDEPRPKRSDAERMRAFQAWAEAIFVELLRVLKPGGHLLSFGGSRTYHRMACAVEDAGFEIRDQIMWVYGSGFPKSRNGEWGGTALKPAHEPIVLARKPLIGTVEANWRTHGTGALNIDGCRIEAPEGFVVRMAHHETGASRCYDGGLKGGQRIEPQTAGRWPANLIHDGSEDVLSAFPSSASPWIGNPNRGAKGGKMFGGSDQKSSVKPEYRDAGSAARFFYCAKASKSDRGAGNDHPTVKPTDLMRYLCRLVTPPGGVVLDPFMGSGSTGKAAMLEGLRFIGCERELEYMEIARARIAHALASVVPEEPAAPQPQGDLFAA